MKNLKRRDCGNKKLKYSLRKLTVGVCSVVIGASFFTGNAFATNENLKNDKVNIKYEYIEESGLSQAEKSLIVKELKDKKALKDETYYIVYKNRDIARAVPNTRDESSDVYKWLLGSAFIVVAVSMKKNRKKTIAGILAISMIGTSVLLTNAYAMDLSKILKNMEYHLNFGENLPDYELDKNLEYVGIFSKSDLMSLTNNNVITDNEENADENTDENSQSGEDTNTQTEENEQGQSSADGQNSEDTTNQGETTETTGSDTGNTAQTDQDNEAQSGDTATQTDGNGTDSSEANEENQSGDTTSQGDGTETNGSAGSEDQKDGEVTPPSDNEKEKQDANTDTTSQNTDENTDENSQSGEDTKAQNEDNEQGQSSADGQNSEDTTNQGETTETTGSDTGNTAQTDQNNEAQSGDTTAQGNDSEADSSEANENNQSGDTTSQGDGTETNGSVGSEDQKDGEVNLPSDNKEDTQDSNTGTTSQNTEENTDENSQSGEDTKAQTEENEQGQSSVDGQNSEDTTNQGETTETTGSDTGNTAQSGDTATQTDGNGTDSSEANEDNQSGDTTSQGDGTETNGSAGSENQKDDEVAPPSDNEKEKQDANTDTTSQNTEENTDENSQSGEATNTKTEENEQGQSSADEQNSEEKPNIAEYMTEDNKTHKILWAKGITPPNMGENGDFKKSTFGQYVEYKAPYKDNMGWYDANKRRDENGSIDASLCFAGVATNMLYWWIDQNRTEIDKYIEYLTEKGYFEGKEKDTIKDIRFLLGEGGKQQDSRIYNMFVLYFFNKTAGYQSDILMDFFINGYKPKPHGGTNSEQDDFVLDNRAGFFNEVFGNKKLTARQFSGNYQSFSNIIKNALSEGSMIGMEHLMTKYTSHIVTLWGAEYDENDKLVAVYVTDTDDQDEANTLGMKRYLVRDVEGRVKISTDEANKEAGSLVEYIHTLKTGKEQWKNFFDTLQR